MRKITGICFLSALTTLLLPSGTHAQIFSGRSATASYFRSLFRMQHGDQLEITGKPVFGDVFAVWDEKAWMKGMPWGKIHPDYPEQYYEDSCVRAGRDGLRLLQLDHASAHFPAPPGQNAVGLVITRQSWLYGTFVIEAVLPAGKNLWPAIWLTGDNSWPPEIDLMEGYSRKGKSRFRLTSNAHYRTADGRIRNAGVRRYYIAGPAGRTVQYAVVWTPEQIVYYADGYRIRTISDPAVMQGMHGKMHLVLNNAVLQNKGNVYPDSSVFIIRSVKVFQ